MLAKTRINKSLNFTVFILLMLGCDSISEPAEKEAKNAADSISPVSAEHNTIIEIPESISEVGYIKNLSGGCGYNQESTQSNLKVSLPNQKEMETVREILSYSGIPSNFTVLKAEIDNAMAVVIENQRYIVYDERLLNFADRTTQSTWSSISILAHEVGHHLAGHTLSASEDRHKVELEADRYSGFVLYKMGANLNQALSAINEFGSAIDSKSHPSRSRRIKAITEGWEEANLQRFNAALPPPPDDYHDFGLFTKEMIIDRHYLELDAQRENSYIDQSFAYYGVITDVDENLEVVTIRALRSLPQNELYDEYINPKIFLDKDINVYISDARFLGENQMCNACRRSFETLMLPGRRVKYTIVESLPGQGTFYNGKWFLTSIEGVDPQKFNYLVKGDHVSVHKQNQSEHKTLVKSFFKLEDSRNFNKLLDYYSAEIEQYYHIDNPTRDELRNAYYNAWGNTSYSQNEIKEVIKIREYEYLVRTRFTFQKGSTKPTKVIESLIVIKFDEEDKIRSISIAN